MAALLKRVKWEGRALDPSESFSAAGAATSPAVPVEADPWLLWQLVDSAFPSGGYVHSNGLESAWRHGDVRTCQQLVGFAEAFLNQLGRSAVPFVTSAHRQPQCLREFDELCDVFTTNHVANRSSRAQGRALLASVTRVFGVQTAEESALVYEHGHLSPVFGAVTRTLGFGLEAASRLFLYQHLRGLFSAAVRLNIVGPLEAQRLQFRLRTRAERIRQAAIEWRLEDIAQTAPILDVWQGAHDRLYSRLFQS